MIANVTMITVLSEAAAAVPLLWINPTTRGGAAWALGLKACLGIRRFELAGALVAQQCGCACPALHHLRRHGRTTVSTNIAPKVDLVLAVIVGSSVDTIACSDMSACWPAEKCEIQAHTCKPLKRCAESAIEIKLVIA